MKTERRVLELDRFEVHERAKGESGMPTLRGHAAVFNRRTRILDFLEEIAPGAFRNALKEKQDVRALVNHDPSQIVGRSSAGTLRLSEDRTGLAVEIDPPDSPRGHDLVASVKRGDLSEMSFQFRVREGGERWDKNEEEFDVRTLTDLDLVDVAPVTFPAYKETDLASRELPERSAELRAELHRQEERSSVVPSAVRQRQQELAEARARVSMLP